MSYKRRRIPRNLTNVEWVNLFSGYQSSIIAVFMCFLLLVPVIIVIIELDILIIIVI
uniref:Uncharacterized protein n=1 Tax=Aegilops tauschii subsp. strangulata TaxID=200361 RepID=A0A453B455_AEGTS